MKTLVKKLIHALGYELKPRKQVEIIPVGSNKRPVGDMKMLIEDLKFRGLKCTTVMDVGANRTYWSRMIKEIYPQAKCYLIEPQFEHETLLKKFCEEFQDSRYFLKGVGAKNEILTMTIWEDLSGSSLIYDEKEDLLKSGKQRKVEVIKIDDLIKNNNLEIPILIKLDIQGFELEALKGAGTTFGLTEVYILEVNLYSFGAPVINEVIEFMKQRGYVIYDFPGFLRRPLDGALYQCDICFVKNDSFLRRFHHWQD